jgi:thioredoxin reductase (NADPH)
MFEGFMAGGMPPGGQLTTTTEVENFPGFPDAISGLDLMQRMKQQSLKYGARVETKTIDKVDLSVRPFKIRAGGTEYQAKSLIIATGASAKRLRLPGENKFRQRGVSACATCDGGLPLFRNQRLVVIGGGDVALEEAMFLSNFGSEVILLVRRDEFRASKAMQEKVKKNQKITVMRNTEATECLGDTTLNALKIVNNKTGEESILECKGLFYAIGHHPNTEIFQGQLDLDADGYLITEKGTGKTNVAGVFAAGDVQDKVYRQAITSAGSGCIAALGVERFLEE